MRIAWDGRGLVAPRTGIGWYTYHLLEAFSSLEEDWQGHLLLNRDVEDAFHHRIRKQIIPFPNTVHLRAIWERILLPRSLRRMDLDVWHSPMTVIPPRTGARKTVATVHDIAFLLYPEIQPPSYRKYWTRWTREACQRADRVIAVSESTRRDLIEHFPVDPSKIAVVQEASDPFMAETASGSEVHRVVKERDLPPRFLLFVGTLEPRKNLPFLLDVYDEADRRGIHLPPLIVAGGKGWLQPGMEERIAGMSDRVRCLGYLGRTELRVLYQQATLVLVPSRYEGFGLQAADAMAAGSLVLASNLSSLPEVVGEGGILLPVEDPGVWVDKISELVEDTVTLDLWREKAKQQASGFSWERAAQETLRVYRNLTPQPPLHNVERGRNPPSP